MESLYCVDVCKKVFEDNVSKAAYLKACKWLAVNVYGNASLSERVVVNIQKNAESKKPQFVITVYVKQDDKTTKEQFCKHCKMLHTVMYSVDNVNCNECKLEGYCRNRTKEIQSIKDFIKERLIES